MDKKKSKQSKTSLAKKLGVSRGMLYYTHKRPKTDEDVKELILETLKTHRDYGHKRIAPELGLNKKRILRVMKKFGIKPYRRRKMPRKPADENKQPVKYLNLIKNFCPIRPNVVWAGDFTYLSFGGQFYFLATVIDIFTREIVGWSFSANHTTGLVTEAFKDAQKNMGTTPSYFHSDQGSEYDSRNYLTLVEQSETTISMSKKSSPWENAFQESFYSHFKTYLGDPNRFNDLGQLIEEISKSIFYYNHDRIHTSLKMSPVKFRKSHAVSSREYLFKELGT